MGGIYPYLLLWLCRILDEAPRDQLPEEDAYDTPANIYLNTVATLYNYVGGYEDSQGLQGTCRGVYDLNTLTTDEALLPTREETGTTADFGKDCSCTIGESIMT